MKKNIFLLFVSLFGIVNARDIKVTVVNKTGGKLKVNYVKDSHEKLKVSNFVTDGETFSTTISEYAVGICFERVDLKVNTCGPINDGDTYTVSLVRQISSGRPSKGFINYDVILNVKTT